MSGAGLENPETQQIRTVRRASARGDSGGCRGVVWVESLPLPIVGLLLFGDNSENCGAAPPPITPPASSPGRARHRAAQPQHRHQEVWTRASPKKDGATHSCCPKCPRRQTQFGGEIFELPGIEYSKMPPVENFLPRVMFGQFECEELEKAGKQS